MGWPESSIKFDLTQPVSDSMCELSVKGATTCIEGTDMFNNMATLGDVIFVLKALSGNSLTTDVGNYQILRDGFASSGKLSNGDPSY